MSISWLCGQLRNTSDARFTDRGQVVEIQHPKGGADTVYCPDPHEYRITADVAKKAADLGANLIAHGSWCEPTEEGSEYAKRLAVKILPYGALFGRLRGVGIKFS